MIEPQMGENIGAAARAMMNFGLCELVVVNPRDGWPNERAEAMASGAAVILENARLAADSKSGLGGFSFALAMTARPREIAAAGDDAARGGAGVQNAHRSR
ncbi:MAG: TrmH family RNA methyltransferase [Parvularculaceae bacterium]